MKRYLFCAMLVLFAIAPLNAQQTPKGWATRVDHGMMHSSDPDGSGVVKFVTMGSGFHATNPQAAVYWNPENTATGSYSVKGTFTATKSMGHSEYYGLIFGGSNLEGDGQNYIYFMVAQDGTWLVKRRNGGTAENISAKTPSDAVKKEDANGKSTNALEVRVTADKITFLVNGTVVDTLPKTGQAAKTDGIAGIRINHMLEVHIDGFAVTKM